MAEVSVRVATWNVHSCIGRDRVHDPGRVRRLVRSMRADIVALQEVDGRLDDRDGFRELSGILGRHHAHCRTLRTPEGDYGHLLLTRWPLQDWRVHDISVAGREPRSVIDAVIETPHAPVRALATHLGLDRKERAHQVRALARLLGGSGMATILLGDFNEPTRFGPAARTFDRLLVSAGRRRTFPARRPLMPLDRIWFSPPLDLVKARTLPELGHASDHLPLLADLAWR